MERVARLLFDRETGAGLSCVRFNIGAGSVWYDADRIPAPTRRSECFQHGPDAPFDASMHEGQQWMLRRARELGVECAIAFTNSPPAWLTANGHTSDDATTGTTNLRFGQEAAFGRFLAKVMRYFEEIGLPFDYLSPINEPQVPWSQQSQEGCRYSNEDTVRTVLAVRAELDRAGIATPLLINECNNLLSLVDFDFVRPYAHLLPAGIDLHSGWQFGGKYCEMVKDVYDLPEIRKAVAPIVSAHSYGTDEPGATSFPRQMAHATLERYGGYRYWMTEYCLLGGLGSRRSLDMEVALYVARVIHADLTEMDASAWQWWLALSGEMFTDGLVYVDVDESGCAGNVQAGKLLWTLGHYARYLRPGSVRVALACDGEVEGLLSSGWLDAGGRPVLVWTNLSDASVEVRVEGLPTEGVLWTTDATRDLERSTVRTDGPIVLPPRSMTTMVG
jgi:O-glycosyl hydrolase